MSIVREKSQDTSNFMDVLWGWTVHNLLDFGWVSADAVLVYNMPEERHLALEEVAFFLASTSGVWCEFLAHSSVFWATRGPTSFFLYVL